MTTLIDLKFQDTQKVIAAFLIKGKEGYVLVETGPHSAWPSLKSSLDKLGVDLKEIKGILVTHIHLDHSGGVWQLAKHGIPCYVHPIGKPHLVDPAKLYNSAGKIYGHDNMEKLWGKVETIDPALVHAVEDNQELSIAGVKIKAYHTPGHASHHIAYEVDGQLFAGDLLGVRIDVGPVIVQAPPPELNVELWIESIKKVQKHKFDRLMITHFGAVEKNVEEHYEKMIQALHNAKDWMKKSLATGKPDEELFRMWEEETKNAIRKENGDEELVHEYVTANPPFMSVSGFKRYLSKLEQ